MHAAPKSSKPEKSQTLSHSSEKPLMSVSGESWEKVSLELTSAHTRLISPDNYGSIQVFCLVFECVLGCGFIHLMPFSVIMCEIRYSAMFSYSELVPYFILFYSYRIFLTMHKISSFLLSYPFFPFFFLDRSHNTPRFAGIFRGFSV